MPHNLIKLAVAAREAIGTPHDVPHTDASNSSDNECVEALDTVEERWMRRLAVILDAAGENSSDAARLANDLWIGGRTAAMDVLDANARGITDLVNVAEPWCALGPQSEGINYVCVEVHDQAALLSEVYYGKIRRHVHAARQARPGAVFLIHGDIGVNRSAAIAAALLIDDGLNLIEVMRLLKERRPRCLTNKGSRLQLVRKARRMNRLAGPDDEDYDPQAEPPSFWHDAPRQREGLFS